MKVALITITIILGLGISGLLSYHTYHRNLAVEESSALVMTVTTGTLVNWDPRTIRQHGTDEFLAEESAEATQRYYTPMSRRLGTLQEIYDIQYEIDMPAWWQLTGPVSASYTMRARFEAEVATIRVGLIRQQGRWLIGTYTIQPPAIAA